VLQHYRAVIALRHAEPAVVHGDFTMLLPDDPVVYAFTRRLGGVELLVLANFSSDPVSPQLPDAGCWDSAELVLGNLSIPPTAVASAALRPWEARILRRRQP
jgi:oligo-1,6-glucosidase